jgi:hypothetical protein
VAGLAGSAWLAFLDAHGGGGEFARGTGSLLGDAPYRPSAEIPVDRLEALVEQWIRNNMEARA